MAIYEFHGFKMRNVYESIVMKITSKRILFINLLALYFDLAMNITFAFGFENEKYLLSRKNIFYVKLRLFCGNSRLDMLLNSYRL